jgi:tape measure domain-containing protein
VAKGDFEYKFSTTADLGNLPAELAKLNAALAVSRGSLNAFKEEFERDAKAKSEYAIVISSKFDASGTKVATAEIKEVRNQYQDLYNAIRRIEKEPQKGSLTSLRQQVNEAKKARDAIAQYGVAVDGVGNRIQALNGKWAAQNQRVRELQKELSIAGASNIWERLSAQYDLGGLSGAGRQITEFVNIFQSLSIIIGQVSSAINTVVSSLGNLQTFNLSFQAIGAGAAGGAQALAESSRIALNLGTDLKTAREGFQQLSPVILNTGGTISDVSSIVETLSSRFAAFGISGDRARRVTNGVIQAFAKGRLQAEELTQQISEADPAFKTDFAKAVNLSVAKLEEWVKAGKITGKVLLENLPKLSKSALLYGKLGNSALDAAKSLGTGTTTIDQVSSKIGSLNQLTLERLAKSIEPVLFAFLQVGASVTDFTDRISQLEIFKSIAAIFAAFATQASALVQGLLNAAEGFIVLANGVNTFIGPFLQIPGVAQLISVALASRLIGPLAGLKAQFIANSAAATGFIGAVRSISTFSGLKTAINNNLIAPIQNFAKLASESTANTSFATTLGRIATGSLGTRDALEKLGNEKLALAARSFETTRRLDVLKNGLGQLTTKLEATRRAAASPLSGGASGYAANIDKQIIRISKLRQSIARLEAFQASLGTQSQGLDARQVQLASGTTILQRAQNGLVGAFKATGGAVAGLARLIGPLGLIFIALGTAVSAYQNATGASNAILRESSERVEVLEKAVNDLTGTTDSAKQPVSGLALAWLTFGNVVANVVESISGYLDNFAKSLQGVAKGTDVLISRLGIVGGGAIVGGLLGLATPLGPVGAAIGAVTGALIAFSLSGNAAEQQAYKTARSAKALGESYSNISRVVRSLGVELDKLAANAPKSIGVIGSDARNKFVQGLEQEKSAIQELQKIYIAQSAIEKERQNNYNFATGQVNKYKKEVERLTIELAKQSKIRDDALKTRGPLDPTFIKADIGVVQIKSDLKEAQQALTSARAGVVSYRKELEDAGKAAKLTKDEIEKLLAREEKGRKLVGFASELDNAINSLQEIDNEIKLLQYQVQNFDLFNAQSIEDLDTALNKMNALKNVSAELSKTKIQIALELKDLQQSIAESQLKIDLDAGPLREAALAVSGISNEFKTAQIALQTTIAEIDSAFESSVVAAEKATEEAKKASQEAQKSKGTEEQKAKLTKEAAQLTKDAAEKTKTIEEQKNGLIEKAATTFLSASQKAKAAIIDAGREFKKQLDAAKGSYQELLLSKPGFFTSEEIRRNAEQIETEFSAAVEKVRDDTGVGNFFPKIEGKTYQDILKSKKEFIDTRKEADNLKSSIDQLNKVLLGLARVLEKISGVSLEELKKLDTSPDKLIKGAQKAQKDITGVGSAAVQAGKAYGEAMGTAVMGGIEMIMTTNKATGEVEWLTKKEYEAAKGAEELGSKGSQAMKDIAQSGKNSGDVFGGVSSSSKELIGSVQSSGAAIFLVQDKFTGKVEEMNQSQLTQAGIVNSLSQAYLGLGNSIGVAGKITGEYAKRQAEQAALVKPGTAAIAANIKIDPNTTQNLIDAGKAGGGDYLRALSSTISKGEILAPIALAGFATVATDYKVALESLALAQNQAKTAQQNYNTALQTGGPNLLTTAGYLQQSNAALEAAENQAREATAAYSNMSSTLGQLGIDVNTVIGASETIPTTGPATLEQAYAEARDAALGLNTAIESTGSSSNLEELSQDAVDTGTAFSDASGSLISGQQPADNISSSMGDAANYAGDLSNKLLALNNTGISIDVNWVGTTGLWTGGPTVGGQTYRINELGKEGFLSPSGDLSPINKPRNALWKAPSKGMVIPAHIMSTLDVPTGRVSTGVRPAVTGSGSNGLTKIARAIQAALSQTNKPDSGLQEMAAVQAHQAIQIGKLSRAVTKLADKDWNVNVGVRNTGSTAYLDALNRRM